MSLEAYLLVLLVLATCVIGWRVTTLLTQIHLNIWTYLCKQEAASEQIVP